MRDIAYEQREISEAQRHEREIDRASLSERKEAQAAYLDSLKKEPGTIAERVHWLATGNYGYGCMLLARDILTNPRANRVAGMAMLVAVHEWQCPRRMAADAWNKLTMAQQNKVNGAIEDAIDDIMNNPEGLPWE
jgi:hypothetical protein